MSRRAVVSRPRLTTAIDDFRDRTWCREDARRIESAYQAERFIDRVGFAACMTDSRRPGPSLYVAVCGRRDAVMPRNVQTDPEASQTWRLKDELVRRGKVYYAKLSRGKAMFRFTKALDELQAAMLVVPSEVLYSPKFTYIWTLGIGRFPDELRKRVTRTLAMREIARCFLTTAGTTLPGELARVIGVPRWEAGLGNQALVKDGFASSPERGIYGLARGFAPGDELDEAGDEPDSDPDADGEDEPW